MPRRISPPVTFSMQGSSPTSSSHAHVAVSLTISVGELSAAGELAEALQQQLATSEAALIAARATCEDRAVQAMQLAVRLRMRSTKLQQLELAQRGRAVTGMQLAVRLRRLNGEAEAAIQEAEAMRHSVVEAEATLAREQHVFEEERAEGVRREAEMAERCSLEKEALEAECKGLRERATNAEAVMQTALAEAARLADAGSATETALRVQRDEVQAARLEVEVTKLQEAAVTARAAKAEARALEMKKSSEMALALTEAEAASLGLEVTRLSIALSEAEEDWERRLGAKEAELSASKARHASELVTTTAKLSQAASRCVAQERQMEGMHQAAATKLSNELETEARRARAEVVARFHQRETRLLQELEAAKAATAPLQQLVDTLRVEADERQQEASIMAAAHAAQLNNALMHQACEHAGAMGAAQEKAVRLEHTVASLQRRLYMGQVYFGAWHEASVGGGGGGGSAGGYGGCSPVPPMALISPSAACISATRSEVSALTPSSPQPHHLLSPPPNFLQAALPPPIFCSTPIPVNRQAAASSQQPAASIQAAAVASIQAAGSREQAVVKQAGAGNHQAAAGGFQAANNNFQAAIDAQQAAVDAMKQLTKRLNRETEVAKAEAKASRKEAAGAEAALARERLAFEEERAEGGRREAERAERCSQEKAALEAECRGLRERVAEATEGQRAAMRAAEVAAATRVQVEGRMEEAVRVHREEVAAFGRRLAETEAALEVAKQQVVEGEAWAARAEARAEARANARLEVEVANGLRERVAEAAATEGQHAAEMNSVRLRVDGRVEEVERVHSETLPLYGHAREVAVLKRRWAEAQFALEKAQRMQRDEMRGASEASAEAVRKALEEAEAAVARDWGEENARRLALGLGSVGHTPWPMGYQTGAPPSSGKEALKQLLGLAPVYSSKPTTHATPHMGAEVTALPPPPPKPEQLMEGAQQQATSLRPGHLYASEQGRGASALALLPTRGFHPSSSTIHHRSRLLFGPLGRLL